MPKSKGPTKKPKGPTPRARSKTYLESLGYVVTPVEQAVKFPDRNKRRCQVCGNTPVITILRDAFNFGDLLAYRPGEIALIQTTSTANQASRVAKILGLIEADGWLKANGKIFVHGWALEGARGTRKRWTVTIQEIRLDDSAPTALEPVTGQPSQVDSVPDTSANPSSDGLDESETEQTSPRPSNRSRGRGEQPDLF